MIDKAHHQNWAKKAFEETLELEKAVKVALELTKEEETLIVVTADHSHAVTMNGYPKRGNDILGKFLKIPPWSRKKQLKTFSWCEI